MYSTATGTELHRGTNEAVLRQPVGAFQGPAGKRPESTPFRKVLRTMTVPIFSFKFIADNLSLSHTSSAAMVSSPTPVLPLQFDSSVRILPLLQSLQVWGSACEQSSTAQYVLPTD